MHASLIRIARSVAVAGAVTLSLVAPVAAGESVDPSTLNPPPPDFFNATCERVGHGVVCELAFSDPPFADEPSGIVCDGTELLVSQTRSVVGKRFYDANGNLLKRHFREDYAGTVTNPSTGQTVGWVAQGTVIHVLANPGELASGKTSFTGTGFRVFTLDGATVMVDAGRVVVDEATGEIIASHGPHRFDAYFVHGDADALQPLCDALA